MRDATPCIDDDVSTPHIHEGFFLFILFHLELVVTAPLPARRGVLLSPWTVLGLCSDR